MLYTTLDSPIGDLLLVGDGERLAGLYIEGSPDPAWEASEQRFATARAQLDEYFAGRRTVFDLPLAPAGTDFQLRVWRALRDIPYGETISYGELARRIGKPSASRAVGLANGRNPLALVVPCHRVVGADGSLTGYAYGVERKRFLLGMEAGVVNDKTYTLIGTDGNPYESSVPGTLGGHRRSKVYGRLDCPVAQRWLAKGKGVRHRVFFADEPTAVAAGYRPCAGCLPERHRAWKKSARAFV